MAKIYRSRSGQVTAIDTKTQLTTLGSQSAPGKLDVPTKAKRLSAVILAFASDMATALGVATAMIRLEGPGVPNGPESISAGLVGSGEAVTGIAGHMPATRIPLGKGGISIQTNEEIQIFAEVFNEDQGAYQVGVTLEFET